MTCSYKWERSVLCRDLSSQSSQNSDVISFPCRYEHILEGKSLEHSRCDKCEERLPIKRGKELSWCWTDWTSGWLDCITSGVGSGKANRALLTSLSKEATVMATSSPAHGEIRSLDLMSTVCTLELPMLELATCAEGLRIWQTLVLQVFGIFVSRMGMILFTNGLTFEKHDLVMCNR